LLNEALALDATYTEAWALLSSAKTILSTGNLAALDEAIAAAETVIELEPSNGAGYAELGFALSARDEWHAAEAAYQRALELGWPLANMPSYSTHQLAVGHIEQAIETLESNLEIDPMNSIALGFLMTAYEIRGDVAKADEIYERGRTLFGDWPWGIRLTIPLRLGRGDRVFLQEEMRPFAEGMTAELLDAAGNPDTAREILMRYASDPATSAPSTRIGIANWAAFLGDGPSLRRTARRSCGVRIVDPCSLGTTF
jgi:tetratricopeptide (TPR) repeat protein